MASPGVTLFDAVEAGVPTYVVNVIAGAAGAPPRWPTGACAINGAATDRMNSKTTSQRAADMLCLLN